MLRKLPCLVGGTYVRTIIESPNAGWWTVGLYNWNNYDAFPSYNGLPFVPYNVLVRNTLVSSDEFSRVWDARRIVKSRYRQENTLNGVYLDNNPEGYPGLDRALRWRAVDRIYYDGTVLRMYFQGQLVFDPTALVGVYPASFPTAVLYYAYLST